MGTRPRPPFKRSDSAVANWVPAAALQNFTKVKSESRLSVTSQRHDACHAEDGVAALARHPLRRVLGPGHRTPGEEIHAFAVLSLVVVCPACWKAWARVRSLTLTLNLLSLIYTCLKAHVKAKDVCCLARAMFWIFWILFGYFLDILN